MMTPLEAAKLDLAVVMPVYNEEGCIVQVVNSWRDRLLSLGVSFRILVLNDGSRDRTGEVLSAFAGDEHVHVIHKSNSGHGPTILHGYALAVPQANWVFQCDSDDEMKAAHFPVLWRDRHFQDALFGRRAGRGQDPARALISACSRLTIRHLFGRAVEDVNVPYRLIRAELLERILPQIPPDTFAPNLIISGTLARAGLRVGNYPVPHENRKTGTVSIRQWKLAKAAVRSFWQTVNCRPTLVEPGGVEHPEALEPGHLY